jgi:hypothetical protein
MSENDHGSEYASGLDDDYDDDADISDVDRFPGAPAAPTAPAAPSAPNAPDGQFNRQVMPTTDGEVSVSAA